MVPLLRDWKLSALTLLSVPFWVDTIIGNTVVFVFAAGAVALNGSRWGALTYLALCCLMPRPLQAPLALWLLWKRPDLRLPFVGMVAVTLGHAIASGYLVDWITALVGQSSANYEHVANFGPTRILGSAWLLVGIPIGAWLTLKGRVGLAGLAVTPYLLPAYFLVLLWELHRWPRTNEHADHAYPPISAWGHESADRIGR